MKNLSSPSENYDALVIVATELDQIKDHVDSSITKDLQTFSEVRVFIAIALSHGFHFS